MTHIARQTYSQAPLELQVAPAAAADDDDNDEGDDASHASSGSSVAEDEELAPAVMAWRRRRVSTLMGPGVEQEEADSSDTREQRLALRSPPPPPSPSPIPTIPVEAEVDELIESDSGGKDNAAAAAQAATTGRPKAKGAFGRRVMAALPRIDAAGSLRAVMEGPKWRLGARRAPSGRNRSCGVSTAEPMEGMATVSAPACWCANMHT